MARRTLVVPILALIFAAGTSRCQLSADGGSSHAPAARALPMPAGPMAPCYLDDRSWGMDQAFMLIVRAARSDPPTDDDLAQMTLTRAGAEELIE